MPPEPASEYQEESSNVHRPALFGGRRPPGGPLNPPGDGGGYDAMNARVGRLEDDVKELKADVKTIRADVNYIKGRLDSMPTTIQLLGFVIAIFVAAGLFKYMLP
jgi:hypothetical protein